MTERMNQLSEAISSRNKEIDLVKNGWYCNRKNGKYKKNDIEFDNAHEAYEYEFSEVVGD